MCASLGRCAHAAPFLIFKHRNKTLPNLCIFQTNPPGKLWEQPRVVLERPKPHGSVVINIETNIPGFPEQLLVGFNENVGWFWFGNDGFWMKQMEIPPLQHSPWSFFLAEATASCQNKLQIARGFFAFLNPSQISRPGLFKEENKPHHLHLLLTLSQIPKDRWNTGNDVNHRGIQKPAQQLAREEDKLEEPPPPILL